MLKVRALQEHHLLLGPMFLCYHKIMAKQEKMLTKKRGRPAIGQGELVGVRLQPALLSALDNWIVEETEDRPGRPEAIRAILSEYLRRRGFLSKP